MSALRDTFTDLNFYNTVSPKRRLQQAVFRNGRPPSAPASRAQVLVHRVQVPTAVHPCKRSQAPSERWRFLALVEMGNADGHFTTLTSRFAFFGASSCFWVLVFFAMFGSSLQQSASCYFEYSNMDCNPSSCVSSLEQYKLVRDEIEIIICVQRC